jgi:hypothetical protein
MSALMGLSYYFDSRGEKWWFDKLFIGADA